MARTLVLKNRTSKDSRTISIPIPVIVNFIAQGDKEKLWEYFERIVGNVEEESAIHDKLWLEMIVNWMPDGGLPMTEVAKWMALAKRVSALDNTRESGDFTLSQFQADLLWTRIKDPRFKIRAIAPQFVDFIFDFQQATGKHFEDEDPEISSL